MATLAMWFFISRLIWMMSVGDSGPEAEILALFLGTLIGLGLTWIYARHFEGL